MIVSVRRSDSELTFQDLCIIMGMFSTHLQIYFAHLHISFEERHFVYLKVGNMYFQNLKNMFT